MEIQANVSLLILLLDIQRHHNKMIVVNPNCLIFGAKFIFQFHNFVCYPLVYITKIFPINEGFIFHIVKILEIMKKWSQDVFVEIEVWLELLCCHENWVSIHLVKLSFKLVFFLLTYIFKS